jgi:hypothetical protein
VHVLIWMRSGNVIKMDDEGENAFNGVNAFYIQLRIMIITIMSDAAEMWRAGDDRNFSLNGIRGE